MHSEHGNKLNGRRYSQKHSGSVQWDSSTVRLCSFLNYSRHRRRDGETAKAHGVGDTFRLWPAFSGTHRGVRLGCLEGPPCLQLLHLQTQPTVGYKYSEKVLSEAIYPCIIAQTVVCFASGRNCRWPRDGIAPGGCLPFVCKYDPLFRKGLEYVRIQTPGGLALRSSTPLLWRFSCSFVHWNLLKVITFTENWIFHI